LWSHDLKLQRASKHLRDLKGEIDRWVEGEGYTVGVEPRPNPRLETTYEVRAYILRDIEEDPFSLLIGDFLQNARSALDYIAYALGEAGAGVEGMSDARNAGFPIIGDERDGYAGRGPDLFAEAASRQLPTVTEPVRTAIEQAQPYNTGGHAWTLEPLWILHELARFDRHRFLHLAVMRTGDVRLDRANSSNVSLSDIDILYGQQVIEEPPWDEHETPAGALLATFRARPTKPKLEMKMNFLATLDLGFDIDTLPPTLMHLEGEEIWLRLMMIEREVAKVIATLRPFLPRMYWDYRE
jgi:hypothetical protein